MQYNEFFTNNFDKSIDSLLENVNLSNSKQKLNSTISIKQLNESLQTFLQEKSNQNQYFIFELIELEHSTTLSDDYLNALMNNIRASCGSGVRLIKISETQLILFTTKSKFLISELTRSILQVINTPIPLDQEHVSSAVIGISVFPSDGKTIDELYTNSLTQVNKLKTEGSNQFGYFNEARKAQELQWIKIVKDLRNAIDQNGLLMKYQPIYHMNFTQIIGCEALLRWNHPSIDIVGPQNFIYLTEESGLSQKLFNWMVSTIEQDMKYRTKNGSNNIPVYIKLTQQQWYMNNLSGMVFDILQRFDVSKSNLVLQVQEADIVDQPGTTEEILQELKAAGILTCIAGATGHPLTEILIEQQLIHCVKLEKQLTDKIIADKAIAASFLNLKKLAEDYQTMLVITGIEGNKQLASMKTLGFQYGQGFILGAPMLNFKYTELLRRNVK